MIVRKTIDMAAHRWAAVRRSNFRANALYPGNWRATWDLHPQTNPIAAPWMRPGDARRRSAP